MKFLKKNWMWLVCGILCIFGLISKGEEAVECDDSDDGEDIALDFSTEEPTSETSEQGE